MPPVWFWLVMILLAVVSIVALVLIDRMMKRDWDYFVDGLELSNRMSKVRAFERCGKEL